MNQRASLQQSSLQSRKLSAGEISTPPSSSDEEQSDEEQEDNYSDICNNVIQEIKSTQNVNRRVQYEFIKLNINKKKSSLIHAQQLKTLQNLMEPFIKKEIQQFQQHENKIIMIQAIFRKKYMVKQFKILQKRSKYRFNVLKELLHTEKVYIDDINTLYTNLFNDLNMAQFSEINQNEKSIIQDMGKQLEKIINTNNIFYEIIFEKFNKYFYNCQFFKNLEYIDEFRNYFKYCQQFQNYIDVIKCSKKKDPIFNEFLQKVEKNPNFRGLDLPSIIVKPIQRLPKYILLLKDLLKHTPEKHSDYQNIKNALGKFEQLNEENNSKMNKYIHYIKLNELSKSIEQDKIEIVKEDREFAFEESLYALDEDKEKSVIAYFLSDLILLVERDGITLKLWKYIELNQLSVCKNISDQKYFSCLFSIKGSNISVTFICESDEVKKEIMTKIQTILKEIKEKLFKKWKMFPVNRENETTKKMLIPVQVNTLGTQINTIGDTYIEYIVQINIGTNSLRIFIRYSELRSIKKMVKKVYKLQDLPKLSSKKLAKMKTKMIEKRKVIIEDFLQRILNEEVVQQNAQPILKQLGINQNIFQELQNGNNQELSLLQDEIINDDIMMKRKISKKVSQLQWNSELSTTHLLQQKLIIDDSSKRKNNKLLHSRTLSQFQGYQFTVQLMDDNILKFESDQMMTVRRLINMIGDQIGIKEVIDFGLFICDINEMKLLDEDTQIHKLINELRKVNIRNTKFIFKKRIILQYQLEENDFNNEPVRLKLIAFQILHDVANCHFKLNFIEYCLIACISIYLRYPHLYPIKDKFASNLIQNQIPIYKKFLEQSWQENMLFFFKKINEEIEKVNKDNNKLVFRQLLIALLLSRLRSSKYMGVNCFYGQIHKPSKDWKHSLQISIGVRFDGILFFDNVKLEKFYSYIDILSLKVFPLSVIFKLKDQSQEFRVDTRQSFAISQLIKEYKELAQLATYFPQQQGQGGRNN